MRPTRNQQKNSLLSKIVTRLGFEPTEQMLFKARVTVVIIAIVVIILLQFTRESAGARYGNYDEVKSVLEQ